MNPAMRASTTTVATATETPITVPLVADGDDDGGDEGDGGVSDGGEGGEGGPSPFGGDGVTPGGAGRPR